MSEETKAKTVEDQLREDVKELERSVSEAERHYHQLTGALAQSRRLLSMYSKPVVAEVKE